MSIHDVWQSFFGEQLPISYLLREQNKDVWFRIHSLPESKRYAEDESEMQEILRRHNTVAAEVLEAKAPCALFFYKYSFKWVREVAPALAASASFFCHYEDEDTQITIRVAPTLWEPHRFDSLLRRVANDQAGHISWMNLQSGELFAPYDGGADLFFNSPQRRAQLRARYLDWLSSHPQGL